MAGEKARGALPVTVAVGRTPAVKEPQLADGHRFWLEQRPQEKGRTTLLSIPPGGKATIELTPAPWNLRSRVHEYGGGVYCVGLDTVVFVEDRDECLWAIDLPQDPASEPIPLPRRLSEPAAAGAPRRFADGRIDRRRHRWIGVMESQGRDQLVAVPLAGGEPELIHAAADFCGYAQLNDEANALVWVEWQQPFMPWERSELWLASVDGAGQLQGKRRIAGASPLDSQPISVFQPLWAGGDLVVANDRSGWWNLDLLPGAAAWAAEPEPPAPQWQALLPMEAEFARPQWVYGMVQTCWDGLHLVAAACREGSWELGRIALAEGRGRWQPFDLPFNDLAGLSADRGKLVAIAASPTQPAGLLELDITDGQWTHATPAPCPLAEERISRPQSLWFQGDGDRSCHSWYYPPAGGAGPRTPLLVKGHSGPTGMASPALNLAIQFWTSRGWGVVDVNYGGSTGFGRAYRERLQGGWGVVDVADCAAAALAVVEAGWASRERIAVEGGSAAGFTVLAGLCFTDVFRAGACRYAVADPVALASHSDHRFEARYLDGLIGPWPSAKATYEERSPLLHADRIRCPVIFFQGLEDLVVPPEQTERMALALGERGVPVEVHLFPGEGHGFRSSEVQIQVLEATEAFFRRHFQLP